MATITFNETNEFLANKAAQAASLLLIRNDRSNQKWFLDFCRSHFAKARLLQLDTFVTFEDFEGFVFGELSAFCRYFNNRFNAVENEIFELHSKRITPTKKGKSASKTYKPGQKNIEGEALMDLANETIAEGFVEEEVNEQYDATAMKEQGDFFREMERDLGHVLRGIV